MRVHMCYQSPSFSAEPEAFPTIRAAAREFARRVDGCRDIPDASADDEAVLFVDADCTLPLCVLVVGPRGGVRRIPC